MKVIRQLAILFAFCVAGDLLSALVGRKIPGNVLGLLLLFTLLATGMIKVGYVEETADFFVNNMAFFFLPACIGILDVFAQVKNQLLPILVVILVSTVITALVAGLTVHLVLRLQRRTTRGEG